LAIVLALLPPAVLAQPQTTAWRVDIGQNPFVAGWDDSERAAAFWETILTAIADCEPRLFGPMLWNWHGCLSQSYPILFDDPRFESGAFGLSLSFVTWLPEGVSPILFQAYTSRIEYSDIDQVDRLFGVASPKERDRCLDPRPTVALVQVAILDGSPGHPLAFLFHTAAQSMAILEDGIQNGYLESPGCTRGFEPHLPWVNDFEVTIRPPEDSATEIDGVNLVTGSTQLILAKRDDKQAVPLTALAHLPTPQIDNADSVDTQAPASWLELASTTRWSNLRHTLIDVLVYLPLFGLLAFFLWNRLLRREIKQRQQAEAQLQALASNIPGLIYQYILRQDGSDAFLYMSSRCHEIWGISADAVIADASQLWHLVHPDDVAPMRAAVYHSARSLTPWHYEWRIRTPQGEAKWLQASAVPQAHPNGDVIWDGFVFDITERQKTELALRQSESRFQSLADNLPGILYGYRLRPDGTDEFTYISSGFTEVYGFPPDAALVDSQVVWQMTHPDDMQRVQRSVQASYQTLQVWQAQYRVLTPNEELKWLQGIARPTQQPNGDVVWDGLIIDMSDRKRTEEALATSELRFRNLAANVPGALLQYVMHPDGTAQISYISPGCYDLWEVSPESVQEDASILFDLVYPADLMTMQASIVQSAHTLQPWSWQWRIKTPSGHLKWLEAFGRPERHENGDIVWDSLVIDISDRKRAELALQTSERRLNTLVSNLPGFIYRAANDSLYTALFVSQGVTEITGYAPEDYLGPKAVISFGEQIHPHDRLRVQHHLQRALAQRQPFECEYRIVTRSGDVKWVWERGQGVFDAANQFAHLEGFITDVSHRKQTELALQESEIRYRQVVEAQTDFILRSRPDTTITFANAALCEALGIEATEIVGKQWGEFANSEDLESQVFQQIAKLTPRNPRCFVENRDTRASGQTGWTQWLNEGIFDDTGHLIEIQSVGRDITDLKHIEQALRDSEERLRLVTSHMSDLVCLYQLNGQLLYVTPSSESLIGYPAATLIDQTLYQLIHPEDRDRVQQELQAHALAGQTCTTTFRMAQQNGAYIWLEMLTKPICDPAHQVTNLLSTARNVSDRIAAEQKLKHDALHDGLTGLPNRNYLMQRLEQVIQRHRVNPDFKYAVLFLDLDNFKVVNDSLGHLIGDELLVNVGHHLNRFIRDTDVAARLGGDEFVILMADIHTVQDVVTIAERILDGLRWPFKVANRDVFINTSIGIVAGQLEYQRAADLLRDADLAMYQAKRQGRSQYALFDPAMHSDIIQRLHLEQDFRQALERHELILYYQPVVALETLQVKGFEALLRWQHPQRGVVSPLEFIPVAEETGLIVPMGQWVLQTACQQLADWRSRFRDQDLSISVNLSVQQLRPALLDDLKAAIAASDIPPNKLILEITESMLVQHIESTQQLLNEVRRLGIRLSIDDFGTGYSSLSYLSQLPVDTLKIDRAFVNPCDTDARNHLIAESIVALSNLLELGVIAEGIQTIDQLEWLKHLGCRLGQGYLFTAPIPAAEAMRYLAQPVMLLES
jgi:diguanylate cyclase (GGDEF)-like protein/PAS domain S-box-containing protein